MKCKLFDTDKQHVQVSKVPDAELEKLVEIQAKLMVEEFGATCFDVKQLQTILSVGESNVYALLRSGKLPHQTIGRRKIVPAAVLARYLIIG